MNFASRVGTGFAPKPADQRALSHVARVLFAPSGTAGIVSPSWKPASSSLGYLIATTGTKVINATPITYATLMHIDNPETFPLSHWTEATGGFGCIQTESSLIYNAEGGV